MAITDIMWVLETADLYPARYSNLGASVTYPAGTNTLQRAQRVAAFSMQFRDYGEM